MITENSLTNNWYEHLSMAYNHLDRNLLDKLTHALYLLERLTETDLNFIFKGGTSLLLLLDEIKRFSIDIDILIIDQTDLQKLKLEFNFIVNQSIFTRWEEQKRSIGKFYNQVSHLKITE